MSAVQRLAVVVGAAAVALPAFPQVGGDLDPGTFGFSLSAIEDVDGDGLTDLVAGAPGGREGRDGSAWVLSGKNLAVLAGFRQTAADGDRFGACVLGLPDLDGDRVPDVAVAGAAGRRTEPMAVRLFSVGTGEVIASLATDGGSPRFGTALALGTAAGERVWLAVGDPGSVLAPGCVWLFDLRERRLVNRLQPSGAGATFGNCVEFGPDIDGDGRPELYVGAPRDGGTGRVYVLSPTSGETLKTMEGEAEHEGFGTSLSVVGDVDGNGEIDLAVGAPGYRGAGIVRVYTPGEWDLVQSYAVDPAHATWSFVWGDVDRARFGWRVAGVGDLTGDGCDDVLVTAPHGNVFSRGGFGWVAALSGKSAGLLLFTDWRWIPPHEERSDLMDVGYSLVALSDVDGDGLREFALGAPDPFDGGGIQLVSTKASALCGGMPRGPTLAQAEFPGADRLGGLRK